MISIFFLPCLLALGALAIPTEKRDDKSSVQIFAYGDDIPGYPVMSDSNGLAKAAPSGTSGLSSVTWTIDMDNNYSWNVTIGDSTTAQFYIANSSDSYSPIGFTIDNKVVATAEDLPVQKSGFRLFGSNIMVNTSDTLRSQFWATRDSNDTDIWTLSWNSPGESVNGSVPVALRNQTLEE